MESILTSIKLLLGIPEDDTYFDPHIIMLINDALFTLERIGVGPSTGFSIEDDGAEWTDFIGNDKRLESVKTYVYLSTKLVFDPPSSSTVLDAFNKKKSELEWRLNSKAEHE